MDLNNKIEALKALFLLWSGEVSISTEALPVSGSERLYFRLKNASGQTALGVYNGNKPENAAFISFSESFKQLGIKVPQIYSIDLDADIYLVEDLGDCSLLQLLEKERKEKNTDFPETMFHWYQKALEQLAYLQIEGSKTIDYKYCYPSERFDRRAMLADCHLFKYWYLFPTQTAFDELALEADFEALCDFLEMQDSPFFMFRDFQARNIMVHDQSLYFIDYQGGRRGPLQYDVASLLFQAKAALPNTVRTSLLEYYIEKVQNHIQIDKNDFRAKYYGFVLLRCLQVLGAYGFKGFFQRKEHFLSSIPYAIENLRFWLNEVDFPLALPELRKVLKSIVVRQDLFPKKEVLQRPEESKPLHLHLRSFSYKKGLPADESGGHGQGFIFDCRLIHNPGRYEHFKKQSGLDRDVKDFLEKDGEIAIFLSPIFQILDQAIEKYLGRGFEYLGINFGCTGGQHRSVYATEAVAAYLQKKYSAHHIQISVEHRERDGWGGY